MIDETEAADYLHLYLTYCQTIKRLAQRTLEIYAINLQLLVDFCMEKSLKIDKITSQQIRSCLARLRYANYAISSIHLTISSWREFFAWLFRFGHSDLDPCLGIRAPRMPKRLPKALLVKDAIQLAEFISEDNDWLEKRDSAIVEVLYGCGLRVSELCSLDTQQHKKAKAWIDLQQSLVFVNGKGGKDRIVPIGSFAVKALIAWLKVRSQKTFTKPEHEFALFIGQRFTRLTPQSIWQRLKRRSKLAGVTTPVHPHILRHSFASHLLQSSQDIRAVQELLGHSSISTTQIYTKIDYTYLSKFYKKAHPRALKNKK